MLDEDPPPVPADLHLLVDGARIDPAHPRRGHFHFRVPVPARDIRLMSLAARPRDIGLGTDSRRLGFALGRIIIDPDGAGHDIQVDSAALADGFHQVEGAQRRWTNGCARLPADLFEGAPGLRHLLLIGDPLPRYLRPDPMLASDAAILTAFENLGRDCELGFLQRFCGAEPVGLMRWGGTNFARIGEGLRTRFEGIGDPAHTVMTWSETAGEYWLTDHRYLRTHTRITTVCADREQFDVLRRNGAARLALLARKLLADIAAARRIMLYATNERDFGRREMETLRSLLDAIGPAPLLCVTPVADPAMVGAVERLAPGLYWGGIDRFVLAEGPYDVWRGLCRTAHAMILADGVMRPS